jgi:hypothetical protein
MKSSFQTVFSGFASFGLVVAIAACGAVATEERSGASSDAAVADSTPAPDASTSTDASASSDAAPACKVSGCSVLVGYQTLCAGAPCAGETAPVCPSGLNEFERCLSFDGCGVRTVCASRRGGNDECSGLACYPGDETVLRFSQDVRPTLTCPEGRSCYEKSLCNSGLYCAKAVCAAKAACESGDTQIWEGSIDLGTPESDNPVASCPANKRCYFKTACNMQVRCATNP